MTLFSVALVAACVTASVVATPPRSLRVAPLTCVHALILLNVLVRASGTAGR